MVGHYRQYGQTQMQGLDLVHQHYWQPFKAFGLTGNFWNINYVIVINTWIVLGVIALFIILARIAIKREDNVFGYLVTWFAQAFSDLTVQSLGTFYFNHFAFIISLFTFIFLCNTLSVIPWLDEPTSDLNTTLGLGITSFLYTQLSSIQAHGFFGHLKSFVQPFAFMLPINIVESLAKIVSISFRLFGNIFGVAVISKLYLKAIGGWWIGELFGIMSGLNLILIIFFVILDGGIQAFVFSMLSLTYLSLEVKHGEE